MSIGSDFDVRNVASRKTEKTQENGPVCVGVYGSEYSSKKAGGDLKRKGKFEPYAY
ncbi:hypothetical protein Hanom_Chr12g01151471 [Helianthus anomalus]